MFSGHLIENVVKTPGSDFTVIVPPWASIACFTMERPRPVPFILFWE